MSKLVFFALFFTLLSVFAQQNNRNNEMFPFNAISNLINYFQNQFGTNFVRTEDIETRIVEYEDTVTGTKLTGFLAVNKRRKSTKR